MQIADGVVQTSGCTVRIKPIGVAEGDGAGTTAYSTDGIVFYTPTQGETNYTSFILIAKKTGCIPVSITVVTSASSTPGTVEHAGTIKTLDALDTAQDTQHGTTQTAIADVPTVSEFNARTLAAADYFDPAADTVANVTTVATVTNLTNLPAITANWLTAAGLAADAVTEIQSGLATAANLATVAGYLDTEIAAILADTDELQTNQGNWLTATGFSTHSAADVWAVATRVLTAGTNIVLAKGTGVTGFNDIAATDIVSAGAITTLSGAVVNVDLVDVCTTNSDMRGTDSAYTGTPPTVGQIADQVWDEAIAGHAGVGSTGEALSAAGSAGDPWSTALPGAYGAGTAGKIIGDNIDAAITSRMATYTQPTGFLAATFPSAVASTTNITAASGVTLSSAGNTAVATAVEAAILDEGDATALLAAIAAKVEEFLVNEGDATATIAAIATACNSAIVAGTVGSNVAAVKAKTDNLPANPAAVGSVMTLTSAYDPAKTASQAGDAMSLTSGERTTLAAAIWNALTSGMTTAGSIGKKLADVVFDWNTTAPDNTQGAAVITALGNGTVVLHEDYDAAKDAASQTSVNDMPTNAEFEARTLAAAAYGTAANQTTLLDRLTSSRAVYLDNLNVGGAVASNADILALNQSASRRILLTTVGQYERPESGSTVYTIEARTFDGDGAATNADSNPTLTGTGQTTGSLAANIGSITNPATGVYRWTYTVASSATIEPIRFDISATMTTAFTLSVYTQVVDFVSATWTASDATKLTAVFDKLPSANYITGTASSDGSGYATPTNITSATGVTVATNNDKTGYALTSAYDPATTAAQAGDAMSLTSGERTTLAAAIWNALTSGMSTVGSIGKKLADVVFNWNTTTPPTAESVASQVRTELTTELGRIDENVSAAKTLTSDYDAAKGVNYAGPRGPGIYFSDQAANVNTVLYTDGVFGNPVGTFAAATTLANSLAGANGRGRIYLIDDTNQSLGTSYDGWEFVGIGGNAITINSQDVTNCAFFDVNLQGTMTGTAITLHRGVISVEGFTGKCFDSMLATVTLGSGQSYFHNCYQEHGGTNASILTFAASAVAYFSEWSGELKVKSLAAGNELHIHGAGKLFIDSTCSGGVITLRGDIEYVDGVAGGFVASGGTINRTSPMLDTEDGSSFDSIPDMATAANQAAIAGYIDTEVAAILSGLTSGIVVLHADYNAAKTAASQSTADADHDTTQAAIAALAFATSADVTNAQSAIIAEIDANEAKIDTGNAVLAKLDTALESDGEVGYQFTTLALENGPSGSGLDAAGVRAAIGLAAANLDTQLGDIPTATENAVAMFTADTGETYASSVAGSVVKEIADNAGVGAIENTVIVSSQSVLAQAVNNSGILTIVTHSVFSVQITGLGDISDRTDLLFTIKASIGLLQNNSDKEAVIQISENGGLLRYNATAASDSGLATLVVDDDDAGDVTIWIHESICSLLAPAEKRPYSFKKVKTGGNDQELTSVDYDNGATTYARILSGVAKTVS